MTKLITRHSISENKEIILDIIQSTYNSSLDTLDILEEDSLENHLKYLRFRVSSSTNTRHVYSRSLVFKSVLGGTLLLVASEGETFAYQGLRRLGECLENLNNLLRQEPIHMTND